MIISLIVCGFALSLALILPISNRWMIPILTIILFSIGRQISTNYYESDSDTQDNRFTFPNIFLLRSIVYFIPFIFTTILHAKIDHVNPDKTSGFYVEIYKFLVGNLKGMTYKYYLLMIIIIFSLGAVSNLINYIKNIINYFNYYKAICKKCNVKMTIVKPSSEDSENHELNDNSNSNDQGSENEEKLDNDEVTDDNKEQKNLYVEMS